MNTRLRDSIQNLLSAHLRGLLLSAPERTPVPGSTSIAKPPYHPPSPSAVTGYDWYIHHGYMPFSGSRTSPLSVYCTGSLVDYISGSGTLIPDSERIDHLIGGFRLNVDDELPEWPESLPELGDDSEYIPTDIVMAEPLMDSSRYAGLAMFLVQSIQGAGRHLSAILPSGFSPLPGTFGCIRSPEGVYWVVTISSAGMKAARLEIPEGAPSLVYSWVLEDKLTGNDALYAESAALGQAKLAMINDPESTETPPAQIPHVVELLTESQIAGTYANGKAPLVWGWCGTWQLRGTQGVDDSGFTICTYRRATVNGVFTNISSVSTIGIGWEDGIPNAEHACSSESNWSPGGGNRITVVNETEACWVLGNALTSPFGAGPVAAYYTPGGEQDIIACKSPSTFPSYGIGYPAWSLLLSNTWYYTDCGAKSQSATISRSASARTGWESLLAASTVDSYTQGIEADWNANMTSVGEETTFGYAANPSQFMQCDGTQQNDYWWPAPKYNIGWIKSGTRDIYWQYTTNTGVSGSANLFLSNIPGVYWFLSVSTISSQNQKGNQHTLPVNPPVHALYGGLRDGVVGHYRYRGNDSLGAATWDTTITGVSVREGRAIVNGEVHALSDAEQEILSTLLETTTSQPCADSGIGARISYGGLVDTLGYSDMDGLSDEFIGVEHTFIGGV